MKKIFLTLILILILCLAPGMAWGATEDDVGYIDASGNSQTRNGVTVLDSTAAIGGALSGTDAWYLVRGTFTNTGTITVNGDVHLILEDGCHLTVPVLITTLESTLPVPTA